MLERLRIRNFQAHRKLEVVLDQVVCIVGASDQGKSAVLRALSWVTANRPTGNTFVTHGEDSCSVQLLADGVKITRSKSKDKNTYKLGDRTYAAFGQDVPQEIADFLKIDPVLNVQKQHDVPFLLGMTAGEAARELNRVIDLGEMDESLIRAQGEVKRAQAELELVEEREAKWQEVVGQSSWVPDLSLRLERWTGLQTSLETTRTRSGLLDELVRSLEAAEDASRECTSFFTMTSRLDTVWRSLQNTRARLATLTDLCDELERLRDAEPLPPLTELEATYARLTQTSERLESLQRLIGELESSLAASRDAGRRLAEARQLLAAVTACPLCEQPIQTK